MLKGVKDGKLKSSSKTKNIQMYGQEQGSKYIYLRLGLKKDYANEILIKNNINLNKYLKKIAIANYDKNIKKIIDDKYPNVKLMY